MMLELSTSISRSNRVELAHQQSFSEVLMNKVAKLILYVNNLMILIIVAKLWQSLPQKNNEKKLH